MEKKVLSVLQNSERINVAPFLAPGTVRRYYVCMLNSRGGGGRLFGFPNFMSTNLKSLQAFIFEALNATRLENVRAISTQDKLPPPARRCRVTLCGTHFITRTDAALLYNARIN